jgi:hypothetical protein
MFSSNRTLSVFLLIYGYFFLSWDMLSHLKLADNRPYCSNGGAVESDSAESSDYGGSEDGTL